MQDHCSRSSGRDADARRACASEDHPAQVTITRAQRDAIHDELLDALRGIGDIVAAAERGEYEVARHLRQRYVGVMRLLDDLGWGPEEGGGAAVAITVEAEELTRTVGFLQARTTAEMGRHVEAQQEVSHALSAIAAYGAILTQLAASRHEQLNR